jgi:hypothetical protein
MDLFEIQKQYPCSNIYQGKKGFLLHTIEENAQQQKRETAVNVNLEDVYLYFFESGLYNR